jgi:hypothetical protein
LLLVTLVVASAAPADVVPVPQLVASGAVTTISFAVPNERPEAMAAVAVSVPSGFRIVRAHPTPGSAATLDGSTVTWRGGPLAHLTLETFASTSTCRRIPARSRSPHGSSIPAAPPSTGPRR